MDLARMREALGLPPDASIEQILTGMAQTGAQLLGADGRPLPPTPEPVNTHTVQAATEGVGEVMGGNRRIEFMGRSFRMATSIGLMPLIRFAHSASKGADSEDMEGLAAMYSMIQDCIDPGDWAAFEDHATKMKAEADDLFDMVSKVIQELSARPTKRPGDSSPGPQPTLESSKGTSSSPATERPQPPSLDELVGVDTLMGRSTG